MKYLLQIICISLFFMGCSSDKKNIKTPDVQEIVVIEDGYKTNADGELIIDDQDVKGQTVATAKEQSADARQNVGDGSQIKVMYDGFGNKTITRFFYNHPLIAGIVSKISSTGKIKTFIYGKGGEVKTLAQNAGDLAQTATADEIAKLAGIFSVRKQESNVLNADYEQENLPTTMANLENSIEPPPINQDVKESQNVMEKVETENAQPSKVVTAKVADNTFMDEFEQRQKKSLTAKKKSAKKE